MSWPASLTVAALTGIVTGVVDLFTARGKRFLGAETIAERFDAALASGRYEHLFGE